jgi:DNA/RNA endonuclease G (NUC1)
MWNFYIPPNSNQDIWLKLENTFDMALNDNSVDYIMATGNLMKTN